MKGSLLLPLPKSPPHIKRWIASILKQNLTNWHNGKPEMRRSVFSSPIRPKNECLVEDYTCKRVGPLFFKFTVIQSVLIFSNFCLAFPVSFESFTYFKRYFIQLILIPAGERLILPKIGWPSPKYTRSLAVPASLGSIKSRSTQIKAIDLYVNVKKC